MSKVFIEKDNLNITWEIIKTTKPKVSLQDSNEFEYRLWLRFNIFVNWKLKSFDYYLDLEENLEDIIKRLNPTKRSCDLFDNIIYTLESLWYKFKDEENENILIPIEYLSWKLYWFIDKFIIDYNSETKEFLIY